VALFYDVYAHHSFFYIPSSTEFYTLSLHDALPISIVRLGVEKYGWFPTQNFLDPPIGANPYALEGCKTMGYEICEQLEWRLPDYVISPVGSGDSMVGMWNAFREWLDLGIAAPRSRKIGRAHV